MENQDYQPQPDYVTHSGGKLSQTITRPDIHEQSLIVERITAADKKSGKDNKKPVEKKEKNADADQKKSTSDDSGTKSGKPGKTSNK